MTSEKSSQFAVSLAQSKHPNCAAVFKSGLGLPDVEHGPTREHATGTSGEAKRRRTGNAGIGRWKIEDHAARIVATRYRATRSYA